MWPILSFCPLAPHSTRPVDLSPVDLSPVKAVMWETAQNSVPLLHSRYIRKVAKTFLFTIDLQRHIITLQPAGFGNSKSNSSVSVHKACNVRGHGLLDDRYPTPCFRKNGLFVISSLLWQLRIALPPPKKKSWRPFSYFSRRPQNTG